MKLGKMAPSMAVGGWESHRRAGSGGRGWIYIFYS